MPISDKAWSSVPESAYADAEDFCGASLIDLNEGEKSKAMCKLPVYEPRSMGRALNRNAVHAAAQRLAMTQAPPAAKRAAARKLVRLYSELNEQPPEVVRRMSD